MSKGAGVLLSTFGILILLYGLFKKKIPKGYDDNFVICKNCLKSYYAKDLNQPRCPDCGGHIENLDGFYGRHPDRKKQST